MASPNIKSSGFVVNLERIIKDYTWNRYVEKIGWPRKMFARKHKYYTDFRWSYLDFKHETLWREWETKNEQESPRKPELKHLSKKVQNSRQKTTPSSKTGSYGGAPIVLHTANYENQTLVRQSYTFSTHRETSASVSVEFQENYTIGGSTNIELKIPGDIVSVSAGVNGELSVTETEGQTFEETHAWDVNTQITVEAGHKAEAFLSVHEQQLTDEFEVKTIMSLAKKWLPFTIRRRDDDTIVYTGFVTSLQDVYSPHQGPNLKVVEVVDPENAVTYNVELISRGRCKTICWTEQQVIVRSELMPGMNKSLSEKPETNNGALENLEQTEVKSVEETAMNEETTNAS